MINQVNKYVIEQVFDYEGVDSQITQLLSTFLKWTLGEPLLMEI